MTTATDSPELSRPPRSEPDARIDPLAMTIEQAAKLLSAAGSIAVTPEAIRRHIEAGAPAAGGRINLVHYAAWLNKDMQ